MKYKFAFIIIIHIITFLTYTNTQIPIYNVTKINNQTESLLEIYFN
jgi:hypothetical protein